MPLCHFHRMINRKENTSCGPQGSGLGISGRQSEFFLTQEMDSVYYSVKWTLQCLFCPLCWNATYHLALDASSNAVWSLPRIRTIQAELHHILPLPLPLHSPKASPFAGSQLAAYASASSPDREQFERDTEGNNEVISPNLRNRAAL